MSEEKVADGNDTGDAGFAITPEGYKLPISLYDPLKVLAKAVIRLNEEAEKIEAWLSEARESKTSVKDLAVAMFMVKGTYDLLDPAVKRLYHVANSLDKGVIPSRFEEEGLDQIRVPEIARSFSIRQGVSASMVDKEKGMEWLREMGAEDLIQQTVNSGTLAAYCKNLLTDQGIEPPPDVIKVTTYNSISVTKYNPKSKK